MIKICLSRDWELKNPNGEIKQINLPNDFSVSLDRRADAPGRGGNGYFVGGEGVYKKYFTLPNNDEHLILDVEGAYCNSEIKLNEDLINLHNHGYTPFLVDITKEARRGLTNKLEIKVSDMQPSTRWYSGAGLYRDVYLWSGGKVRLEPWDVFVTTVKADEIRAEIKIAYTITSDIADVVELIGEITAPSGAFENFVLCADVKPGKNNAEFTVFLEQPELWDTENPNLYTLKTTVQVNADPTDVSYDSFGIRTISADAANGFRLNGKPMKMKGGCIHHTHGALGAEDHPEAIVRELTKLKSVGFNAIRSAHNPPSLNLLEACDRLGMFLMDEAFDMWRVRKNKNDYHLWFEYCWAKDIERMVKHGRNHPCVISYSIGNEILERAGESDGYKWAEKLSAEIRKHDTTRFVTSGICDLWSVDFSGAPEEYADYAKAKIGFDVGADTFATHTAKYMESLDIVGYNYLHDRYRKDHFLFPNRVIWGSETWAITIYDSWKETMENKHVIGDFCWTCYDNLGESGTGRSLWARDGVVEGISLASFEWISCFQGDFDLAGFRRPQSYYREAIWKGIKADHRIFTTHPEHYGEGFTGTQWHFYDVHESWTFDDAYLGKPVKIETYTLADEVVWYINGKNIGSSVPEKAIASITVPYEKGVITAKYIKDGREYTAATLETVGNVSGFGITEDNYLCDGSEDIFYFNIFAVDEMGRIVTNCTDKIECEVKNGEILGVFSGDPKAADKLTSNCCDLFDGTAVACIKANSISDVKITVNFK